MESYVVGGLDTFVIDLLNNWPNNNDTLVLLCNSSHSGVIHITSRLTNPNASLVLHNLPMVPDKQNKFKKNYGNGLIYKVYSVILQYSLFIYYIFVSYKKLKLYQFEKLMVINGGYPAGPSCRAISIAWGINTGRKSIHNFHNYAVPPKKIVLLIENLIDSFVCKYTDCFVSVSKSCSESIKIRPSIKSFKSIKFIYNGINSQIKKSNNSILQELGLNEATQICLMLATYEKRKGHEFLFNAYKKVQNINNESVLICCGYGTTKDLDLNRNIIKKLGLEKKIFLVGFRNDAMEILSQADILLISSQEFESFGLTAIEAMKYKKPIVSTNVGGLSEVIKNGEGGYLFEINDINGYSSKIEELLNNPNLRFEQGKLGYNRYLKFFQIKRVAQKYYKLINRL